jgi:hypothetical protein
LGSTCDPAILAGTTSATDVASGSAARVVFTAADWAATSPEVRIPRSGAGLSCGMNLSNVPTCLD